MSLKQLALQQLFERERFLLNRVADIESWFRAQWRVTAAPLMTSVDVRHAGFKLAAVDTNLFPAGFNNLNPDCLPLCVQALQSALGALSIACRRVLLIPEAHTRNRYYLDSLNVLVSLLTQAGFEVLLGHWDPQVTSEMGQTIALIERVDQALWIKGIKPCVVILNNDLSVEVPAILQGIEQPIFPALQLGWATRRKSQHFAYYAEVVEDFAAHLGCDPWFFAAEKAVVEAVDFMQGTGLDALASAVEQILANVRHRYQQYGIQERPFVVVKADNGTYGMSVMTVYSGEEVLRLNRKQRTKMSASKGGQTVHQLLVQEGIYTVETTASGGVAEPVVYLIGGSVVGGFYRVHQTKGPDANLNAPGMYFEPLPFENACNIPCCKDLETSVNVNRFYVYGVIARLAALAAGKEIGACV